MRHLSWLIGLSCALGWAVGCGGDSEFNSGTGGSAGSAGKGSGGSSGSSSASVPLEDVPDAYAGAYCSLLERCAGVLFDSTMAYEDCETLTSERVRQEGYDALSQAVDDGRIEYHANLVPACIDAVENRDCAELNNRDIEACNAAIVGTAAEGEPCTLNDECEGSLICETKDACPGTCVNRYSAGVECASDDECADGLVCSNATAHCVKPTADGEACGGGVEAQCEAGFLCTGDDKAKMQTGKCIPMDSVELGGVADGCDPTTATLCEEGLSCVLLSISDAGFTWECQPKAASGATCGIGIPEACPAGEYCPVNAVSVAAGMFEAECTPLPAIGDDCAERPLDGILPDCVPYARCDGGTCVGLRDLGETCSRDGLCYSGHCVGGACEPGHACSE